MWVAPAGDRPGSAEHKSRSRAKPSLSRHWARTLVRAPRRKAAATSSDSDGRITSAAMVSSRARKNASCCQVITLPFSCSQPTGISRQARPAVSVPLASHRSCQVWPG
jgi:hypothetical protein